MFVWQTFYPLSSISPAHPFMCVYVCVMYMNVCYAYLRVHMQMAEDNCEFLSVSIFIFFLNFLGFFVDFTLCTPTHSSPAPLYLLLQPLEKTSTKEKSCHRSCNVSQSVTQYTL